MNATECQEIFALMYCLSPPSQALAVSDLSKMFSPPDSMNEVEIEVAQALNSGSKAELAGAVELLKQRSQVRELVAVMKQQLPEVYVGRIWWGYLSRGTGLVGR